MNYNEVIYKYTRLEYNDQVTKVAIRNEFSKVMPPGDLTVIGRCSDDDFNPGSVRFLDGDIPVAGRRQFGLQTILR